MESGPIYNQVIILFSESASLDSYWFRQIWVGERRGKIPRDRTPTVVGNLLMLLLYPAVVLVFIPAQHSRNKIFKKSKERKKWQNQIASQ